MALTRSNTGWGACGGGRSQGAKVTGNSKGAARVFKERKYRQYMNRRDGLRALENK